MIAALRDAAWLTPARARLMGGGLLVALLVTLVVFIATIRDGLSINGMPAAGDFLSFWAASDLVLAGRAADVYVPEQLVAAQARVFPGIPGYFAYFYPPVFLLLCAPLALLPYGASVATWLVVTWLGWFAAMRALAPPRWMILALLAFPAAIINMRYGQNGFLSAAIFAMGAALLDRRPVLAGAVLGLLAYKPHLAVAVPFVLAAAGRWPAFLACGATAAGLAALSWAVFGTEVWAGFHAGSDQARLFLEQGRVTLTNMVSVFAGIRQMGGGVFAAYAGQAAVGGLALLAALVAARRRPGGPVEVSLMVAAALLVSPFVLDYDLMIISVPLGVVLLAGSRTGFLPWEKVLLVVLVLWPLVALTGARVTGLPISILMAVGLLWLVVRRSKVSEALTGR